MKNHSKTVTTRAPWTRRKFVGSLALAAGYSSLPNIHAAPSTKSRQGRRLKVALLATEVKRYSHAQHFIDRLLEGYGWQGKHHMPPLELAGLYVDQIPENDLSRDRIERHKVKQYPTIAESLTLGTSKLAVDGVLIIGEHGKYPKNEKNQTLYPRYKWFKEIVNVFENSGRSVPVFNDKHLSTEWKESVEMVEDSRRLGFAFLAGSSLPVTWRIPALELPIGCDLAESVCACYGGVDSYDFHGLETAQCMSERRRDGEVGVKAIEAVRGDRVWEILQRRPQTRDLLIAALSRSHTMSAPEGFTFAVPSFDPLRNSSPNTTAYFVEHLDGFKTSMFLLNGNTASIAGLDQKSRDALWIGRSVRDFTYAGRLRNGKIESCKFHLPMPPWYATLADFFNPLMNHIETTVLEKRTPYPIERTLLTTGMTSFAIESLSRNQALDTPELKIAYKAPSGSHFWRS